nr:RNA polymerase subunit sigma [Rhizobium sp. Q54]
MQHSEAVSTFRAEVIELIPALRSFARRFSRDRSEQDDLIQKTLLKALANADKFKNGTNLKSWLFTIERNIFCTKYGRSKREFVGKKASVDLQAAGDPPQEWSIREKEFQRELHALPDHYRHAVNLVLIDGVSYKEAAHQIGCAVGTVKSRVNRGRRQLADRLTW